MSNSMFPSFLYIGVRKIGNLLSCGGRLSIFQSVLRRIFRFSKREVVVRDFDGSGVMKLRLSEHMQRRIFWMGYYNADIVALLNKLLKPGMVVVDVGANIGEITLVAARRVGRAGRVIAFEPVSSISDRLAEHLRFNNLSHVDIRREALGKEKKELVPIFSSCGQSVSDENEGLASLYGASGEPVEYVDVSTLDDIAISLSLDTVDLIKVDIEGGELACLQGAENVLRRFQPLLIIEVQSFSAQQAGWEVKEIFQYLGSLGYEFFTIGTKGNLVHLEPEASVNFQNVFCRVRS